MPRNKMGWGISNSPNIANWFYHSNIAQLDLLLKHFPTGYLFMTCKISEPYDIPFWEKSNAGGKKKERREKNGPIELRSKYTSMIINCCLI